MREGARAPGPPPPLARCLCRAVAAAARLRGSDPPAAVSPRAPRPSPPHARHARPLEQRARRLVRCLRGGGHGGGDAAGAGGEAVPVPRRRGTAGERALAGWGHPRRVPAGLAQPRPGGKSRGSGWPGGCGGGRWARRDTAPRPAGLSDVEPRVTAGARRGSLRRVRPLRTPAVQPR